MQLVARTTAVDWLNRPECMACTSGEGRAEKVDLHHDDGLQSRFYHLDTIRDTREIFQYPWHMQSQIDPPLKSNSVNDSYELDIRLLYNRHVKIA